MKKIFWSALLAVLLPCCAQAHDFVVDGICYNITSEEEKTVEVTYNEDEKYAIKRKFYKDVVFVPEKVTFDSKEYTVTAIGERAFTDHEELLSVVMPNTLLVIKDCAFVRCPQLKSITIPASVTEIEPGAFQILGSLTNLAVDEGNKVYDSRKGCNAIIRSKTATLLFGCKSTIIPDGVEVIARNAFWPVPDRGVEPFALEIPGSVKVIKSSAFAGREWLNAVVLHEGIEVIEGWAFDGTSIENLVIPKSVKRIDPSAFRNNPKLTSIKVKRGNKVYDSRKGCNAIIESTGDRLIQACVGTVIPKSVKVIGNSAFSSVDVPSVEIPSSVVKIENGAFMGSDAMKRIVIPGNVKSIGSRAFSSCYGLEEIIVEEGVESLETSAFSNCINLRRVELPVSLEKIGNPDEKYRFLFNNCHLLSEVVIPEENPNFYCYGNAIIDKKTLTVISGFALDQCHINHGLRQYMPKKIASQAFAGFRLLTSVWLPESVEEIESYAFYDCPSLRLIHCSSKVPPVLGDRAFVLNNHVSDWNTPMEDCVTVIVPEGSLNDYRNAPGWKEFKRIIEN
ncbi:MAG: leucine-rich repeat domain-containing protein [Bacteroidaceae bacterium]|nr:leucine-rich repeat domain-containing protein [Bacteroidaceae bacterium]